MYEIVSFWNVLYNIRGTPVYNYTLDEFVNMFYTDYASADEYVQGEYIDSQFDPSREKVATLRVHLLTCESPCILLITRFMSC